jgi:type 1 glutamine amidotransferase
VLTPRNIELTYTEAMTNLNAAHLAQFDALLIFANITRISPEQEKAMLDFVAAGGGLVPIHCASFCFHNSTNYIELVGAQFRRHTTGVIKETIVNADHPVMKGLSPIESWDETYVHAKHNTNRIVLAERRYTGTTRTWAIPTSQTARNRGPGFVNMARAACSTPRGVTTNARGPTPAFTPWSKTASAGRRKIRPIDSSPQTESL